MNRNAGRHCVAERSCILLQEPLAPALQTVTGSSIYVGNPRKQRVKWAKPVIPPTEIEESMGTSYQKGWVMLRGKKWYGYFRRTVIDPKTNEPKPAITPIILGLKVEMSKSQARAKLEVEIGKLGKQSANGDRSIISGTVTLAGLSKTVSSRSRSRIGERRRPRSRSI